MLYIAAKVKGITSTNTKLHTAILRFGLKYIILNQLNFPLDHKVYLYKFNTNTYVILKSKSCDSIPVFDRAKLHHIHIFRVNISNFYFTHTETMDYPTTEYFNDTQSPVYTTSLDFLGKTSSYRVNRYKRQMKLNPIRSNTAVSVSASEKSLMFLFTLISDPN